MERTSDVDEMTEGLFTYRSHGLLYPLDSR